jgi:hypothetical protein
MITYFRSGKKMSYHLLERESETKLQGTQKNIKLQEDQLVEQLTIIRKNIL